jgi:hypothetical protein
MEDIKKKVDCTKYPETPLHEKLVTILQELSHHNADLTYVATDASWGRTTSLRTIQQVAVYDGYQPIGEVSVQFRSHTNEMVFAIKSDNIKGGRRGNSHHKESKHLKEVMKIVKEAFKPKATDVIVQEILEKIDYKTTRLESWARDHCRSVVNTAGFEVLDYLLSVYNGEAKTNELPTALRARLGTKWIEYMDNYRIAQTISHQWAQAYGVAVRIERDGTINVVDLATKTLSPCKSTYDLPTNYQEKITMLKIVEEDQPIEHIGFRFENEANINGVRTNYEYFYLVGGDTFVSC